MTKNGKTQEVTYQLFASYVAHGDYKYNNCVADGPYFLKYKEENVEDKTGSVALFVFEYDNINCGTQLYRIDKQKEFFGENQPSSHKQRGGEKIITKTHIHAYNLIDSLLQKENTKGHMDIAYNLTTTAPISMKAIDSIFNNKCKTEKPAYFDKNKDI